MDQLLIVVKINIKEFLNRINMFELLECVFETEQENNNLKLFFNNKYLESEFKNILYVNQYENNINKNSFFKKNMIEKFKKMNKEKLEIIELNLDLENMLLHFGKYKFSFKYDDIKTSLSNNSSYFSIH